VSFDIWLKSLIQPAIQNLKAGKLKEQAVFSDVA
jgi:hypothetical protein